MSEDKKICIIGSGASGSLCGYFLREEKPVIYDVQEPLKTLLPTGGGRCNLSHAEFDIKDLVKNYPRGEKFLYSIFSRFGVYDTLSLFEELGIKTYTQDNGRIFPVSNSSKDVRNAVLKKINHLNFKKEKVLEISSVKNGYEIKTSKGKEFYTHVIVAIGGHSGYGILKNINIKIVPPKPSLVGLKTKEDFSSVSGVVIKSVKSNDFNIIDDVLFTHFGVSGPLIYTLSSINARKSFPYSLSFDLFNEEYNLQSELNSNPHKDIKNILSSVLPKNFVKYFLEKLNIDGDLKGHSINKETREKICSNIHNYVININGTDRGEETVTSGGVDLTEIIPQSLMSKKYNNLYFCGEVLDIDGFCGGFNLQNAWSTAFVVSQSILKD